MKLSYPSFIQNCSTIWKSIPSTATPHLPEADITSAEVIEHVKEGNRVEIFLDVVGLQSAAETPVPDCGVHALHWTRDVRPQNTTSMRKTRWKDVWNQRLSVV